MWIEEVWVWVWLYGCQKLTTVQLRIVEVIWKSAEVMCMRVKGEFCSNKGRASDIKGGRMERMKRLSLRNVGFCARKLWAD